MLRVASEDYVVVSVVRVLDWIREFVFAILYSAWLKAVDVLPCLWLGEC
jgi:hypothetical protein